MTKMSKKLLAELTSLIGAPLPPVFTRAVKPLKLGIYDDLRARYPQLKADDLSRWLSKWVTRLQYHQRVAKGRERYDLDCQPVGKITDQERRRAQIELAHTIHLEAMEEYRRGFGANHPDYRDRC
jgi:sRNA-binding protein